MKMEQPAQRMLGFGLFTAFTVLMRSFTIASSSLLPPVCKKMASKIYIGKNPLNTEEFRGKNVMDPPIIRHDDYQWLRDETRKNPAVIDQLKAENAYCAEMTKHLEASRNELYNEMLSHLKETDDDLPYPYDNYEYYSKTIKGLSYKIHCRRLKGTTNEDIILDENEIAKGQEYSVVSGFDPSPDHKLLAYGVDNSGYETYSLKIKDLATGKLLDDVIEEISGDVVWNSDSKSLFYMKMDDEHRPFELYYHIIGQPQSEDISLFKELDQMFWLGIDKTHDSKYLVVSAESKETSEQYLMQLNGKELNPLICLEPRKEGVRYHVESHEDNLFIITNKDNAKNNKVVKLKYQDIQNGLGSSIDVRPYDPALNIEDLLPFEKSVVLFGRRDGLEMIWVSKNYPDFSSWEELQFDESLWSVWNDINMEYKSTKLRFGYSSFVSPKRIMEYDMSKKDTNSYTILKQIDVPNYNPDNYKCHRIMATARDGTKIPISLVHHKKINVLGDTKNEPHPLILYGYGSYGASIDPGFDFKRIPLLDKGVIWAVAHIRGGGELGRAVWYEEKGKYLEKKNTFTDFADCALELQDKLGMTSADKTAIIGRSAGGLLVGACVNMFPKLFKAAVADVPFVDVVNTMSDPTIPLTVGEWEEWGNPNESKFYDYMLSYSPYDNVVKQEYPAMLVTAGLNDPRVAYWEPMKFVAKLREMKTDKNELLFKTDLTSGHFSASDRYKYLKEAAFEYSWILSQISKSK